MIYHVQCVCKLGTIGSTSSDLRLYRSREIWWEDICHLPLCSSNRELPLSFISDVIFFSHFLTMILVQVAGAKHVEIRSS